MNTFAVKHCSFALSFKFFVDGELVAIGRQQMVFVDDTKRIARLPADVLARIASYVDPAETIE